MAPEIKHQIMYDDLLQRCTSCEELKTTNGSEHLFLKSVSVWINKPHVVNRRLCGSQIVKVRRFNSKEEANTTLDEFKLFYVKKKEENVATDGTFQFTDLADETASFTVIVRELIPKSEFFPKLLEAIFYDKERVSVRFIPICQDCTGTTEDLRPTDELQYQVELTHEDSSSLANEDENSLKHCGQVNKIKLQWTCDHTETELPRRQITSKWLRGTLLDKLINWSQVNNISTSVSSLRLVAVDEYKDTYTRLKNTYGRELVKNWTECTDPKKFVYEDVAIAAYLLLIWEEDRQKKNLSHKQSFVDLGCGNGLLVYILTKEGHRGLGIDLRKRKIWDTFGPGIELKEEAITPSGDHLYPEFDWIIGNHSDELTPWIPVIAARSSYNTCFFLLPCCPHDFDCKFDLTQKGKGRYGSYIDYVKDITSYCGFKPESDSLRIPSTKRICFIGRERSYEQQNELLADARRQAFIDKRTIYSRNLSNQEFRKQALKPTLTLKKPDGSCFSNSLLQLTADSSNRQDVGSPDMGYSSLDYLSTFSPTPAISKEIEKRKFENLGSTDSGIFESDSQHEPTCTKRLKNDSCGKESAEFESSDPSPTGDKSSFKIRKVLLLSDSAHNLEMNVKSACNTQIGKVQQQWAQDFQPRVEPGVRNCQNIPEEVKSRIVQAVFAHVLAAPDSKTISLSSGKTWTKGGSVALNEVASLFKKSDMQELKSEFGGLQTLLRNHSHIFQVTGGYVQLRDFSATDPWKGCNLKKNKNKRGKQQDTRKTTLCWFDANHPNGCPKTNVDCQFAHGIGELRAKLVIEKVM